MFRRIIEGVDLRDRYEAREHTPRHQVSAPQEIKVLSNQYKVKKELGLMLDFGEMRPQGE